MASFSLLYFRIGTYYAVMLAPNTRGNEYWDVMIFEEGSLRFLGSVLV